MNWIFDCILSTIATLDRTQDWKQVLNLRLISKGIQRSFADINTLEKKELTNNQASLLKRYKLEFQHKSKLADHFWPKTNFCSCTYAILDSKKDYDSQLCIHTTSNVEIIGNLTPMPLAMCIALVRCPDSEWRNWCFCWSSGSTESYTCVCANLYTKQILVKDHQSGVRYRKQLKGSILDSNVKPMQRRQGRFFWIQLHSTYRSPFPAQKKRLRWIDKWSWKPSPGRLYMKLITNWN